MSEISVTHDSIETKDVECKTMQSINSSCSTKKIFFYENLLKVKKNTPRSDMDYLKTKYNTMDNSSETVYFNKNKMNGNYKLLDHNSQECSYDESHNLCSSMHTSPQFNDSLKNRDQIEMEGTEKFYYEDLHYFDKNCDIDILVKAGEHAILNGILPQRIHQGSSGSYFVKDVKNEVIAVFKPKNEEPYGKLNPKWLKWMHKTCLPCCFGRSCILPNQGYLSEVGASVVDNFLATDIVPKTTLAWLSSPTFNYTRIDRSNLRAKRLITKSMPSAVCKKIRCELPPKVGSYQKFVKGYMNPSSVLNKMTDNILKTEFGQLFLTEFQKMTIFDYFIRNTDRGHDNWLIKLKNIDIFESQELFNNVDKDIWSLAAIDNGLAFPFKHPDSWRSYPFLWAWLPCAKYPYLESVKENFLKKLSNSEEIEDLVWRLKALFSIDKGFSEERFNDQMSVMKGQIYNICNALRNDMSPMEMVKQNPIYIRSQVVWECISLSDENVHHKKPLFSCI